MARKMFPKADVNAAQDFYALGRARLEQFAALTPDELIESIGLALLSHRSCASITDLYEGRVKLCGPKRRRKKK